MILGAILIILAASLSTVTFSQSAGELDSIFKEKSYFLAYSCLDHALLKLVQDSSYAGSETYSVGSDQCTIGAIGPDPGGGSNAFLIPATAMIGSSTTKLQLTVNSETLQTIKFEEK